MLEANEKIEIVVIVNRWFYFQEQYVSKKDKHLGEIYKCGSFSSPGKRIKSDVLVKWFRENAILKRCCFSFQPKPLSNSQSNILPNEDIGRHIVRS